MKALASMASQYQAQINSGKSSLKIEETAAWSKPPLVLVKPRPVSEQAKSMAAEDNPYFQLGYN